MMLTTTTTMTPKTHPTRAATTLALALALTPLATSCTFGSDDDGAEVSIAVTQSALTDAQRDEIELIEVTASHPALSTPRSNWLGGSRLREGSAVRFRGLPASRNSDELVRFTAVAHARGRKPIWYAAQEQLLRPGTNSLRLAMQRADYELIPADAQLASPGATRNLTVEALVAGEAASASNLANLDFAWQQVSGNDLTLAPAENPREAEVNVPEDYAGEAAVFEVTAKLKAAKDDPRFTYKARTTLFFAGTASVVINSLTEGQTLTVADDQDSSTPNTVDVTVSGTTGLSTEGIPVTVYLNDATTPAGRGLTNPDGSFDVEAIALTTGAQKITVDIGPGFAKGSVNVLVDVGAERLTVEILEPAADSPDLPADINPNTAGLQINVRARVTPVPASIRQAILVVNGTRSGTAPINDSDGDDAGLINFGEVTLPDGVATYTLAVFVGGASDSVTLGRPALEARFSQTGGGPLGNIFGLNVDADGELANGVQTEVIVTPRGLPVGTVIAVTGADATQNIRAADPGAELTFDINLLANTTQIVASATIPGGATVEPVTLVAIPDLLPPGIEALITPETVGTLLNLANDLAQDVIPNTPELDLNIGANIIELNPGELIVRIAGEETPAVTAPRDEGGALWVVPNVEFPQGDILYQLEMTDLGGNTSIVEVGPFKVDAIQPGQPNFNIAPLNKRLGTARLTFTVASEDVGNPASGPALRYRVEYTPLIDVVSAVTVAPLPITLPATTTVGSQQTVDLGGLQLDMTYRVSFVAIDANDNPSNAKDTNLGLLDYTDARLALSPAIVGNISSARLGTSAAAFDYDGDGLSDLFIGVPGATAIAADLEAPGSTVDVPGAGQVDVIFGAEQIGTAAADAWGRAVSAFTLDGQNARRDSGIGNNIAFANFGTLRPQTTDKVPDLIITAQGDDKAYVFAMPYTGRGDFDGIAPAPIGAVAARRRATIVGAAGSNFGARLGTGFDLDSDNLDDLAIGAPRAPISYPLDVSLNAGRVSIIPSGKITAGAPGNPVTIDVSRLFSINSIDLGPPRTLADQEAAFGTGFAVLPSIGAEGKPGLLVGAPRFDGLINPGRIFLWLPELLPALGNILLDLVDESAAKAPTGTTQFGSHVLALDFNNDNRSDAIAQDIGSTTKNARALLFAGNATGLNGSAILAFDVKPGAEVCLPGDLDGNPETTEIGVPLPKAPGNNPDGDRIAIWQVRRNTTAANAPRNPIAILRALTYDDEKKLDVKKCGPAGDINGDGAADLWVSDPDATVELFNQNNQPIGQGPNAGALVVLY